MIRYLFLIITFIFLSSVKFVIIHFIYLFIYFCIYIYIYFGHSLHYIQLLTIQVHYEFQKKKKKKPL